VSAAGRYLMESGQEALRLDLKTDPRDLKRQARWGGVRPGMRLGDFGCGPGKTSFHLKQLVGPEGEVVAVDRAEERIAYARAHYAAPGIRYVQADIRGPLAALGAFDFIWMRFVLEHYRSSAFDIVRHVAGALRPGGVLCLADLDHNCLSHHEMPPRLERTLFSLMEHLAQAADFDPYAGRRLYAHLYDLGFEEIRVNLYSHHLIYGRARPADLFNWTRKVEVAARHSGYPFEGYAGGFAEFAAEFRAFFEDPRRFTYSPLIVCRGRKPAGAGAP